MRKRINDSTQESGFRILLGIALSLVLAVLFVGASAAFLRFSGTEDPFQRPGWPFAAFLALYTALAYALVIRLGIQRLGKESLRRIGWFLRDGRSDVALGVAGGLLAAALVFLFGFLLGAWDWQSFAGEQARLSPAQRLLFLLVGLQAGFIEESLFRGFLQPAMIEKLGIFFGIGATSFLFAFYHLQFHPAAFGGKVIVGLVLGFLRGRSSSLVRPAIAHALLWLAVGTA